MRTKTIYLLFAILSFGGCRKLIDIDHDYIGYWNGRVDNRSYTMNISEDGGAKYERIIQGPDWGHEYWFGTLKSNGKRFQIAYASPWFIILENPVLTDDDCTWLFSCCGPPDTSFRHNNWRIRFKYPKTIGYDGAEVTMYRHQY